MVVDIEVYEDEYLFFEGDICSSSGRPVPDGKAITDTLGHCPACGKLTRIREDDHNTKVFESHSYA